MTLSRRGRPPRIERTSDGGLATVIKGVTVKFKRDARGSLRLANKSAVYVQVSGAPGLTDEDIAYARQVVTR